MWLSIDYYVIAIHKITVADTCKFDCGSLKIIDGICEVDLSVCIRIHVLQLTKNTTQTSTIYIWQKDII